MSYRPRPSSATPSATTTTTSPAEIQNQPSSSSSSLPQLHSSCLSILLAQHNHPVGFPQLTPPPRWHLSPLCALQPSEHALLALWDELRDAVHQRLRSEARAELAGLGELESELEGEEGGEGGERGEEEGEGEGEGDAELAGRIKELEEKVARLRAEEVVKEEIALGIVTAGDVQKVVYGVRNRAGETRAGAGGAGEDPSSVVMLRSLRAVSAQRHSYITMLAALHSSLTAAHASLAATRAARLAQTQTNRLLATRLSALTASSSAHLRIEDRTLQEKIEESESRTKLARMRWEVARNVFQGAVAGSGVDWVRVEHGRLAKLMLEAGEEPAEEGGVGGL